MHTIAVLMILGGLVGLMVALVAYALNPGYRPERARPSGRARHTAPLRGRRRRRRQARDLRARLKPRLQVVRARVPS